jgi:large subunit ribosomal protein L30
MEKQAKQKKTQQNTGQKLAAIRIRGHTQINTKVEETLQMLRLYRANFCIIVPNTPVYEGMLKRAKDYLTWGEIDDDTFQKLVEKRGEEFNGRETDTAGKITYNDFIEINSKKLKRYFRLNSPKKGLGRKGMKQSFKNKGALGYRGSAINDLIKRML